MKYYAGIDVGGTKVAIGIFGEDKTLLGKRKFPSDPELSGEEFFQHTVSVLKDLLEELSLPLSGLSGVGVGLPCMVRYPQGEVVICAMLPALNGFGVKACLEGLLPGVQVEVDNDAHCAALAESRHGAGIGRPHMLYCPVSTGLSSGIIIDGRLFRGSNGFAGESGHTVLTPGKGIPCGCGNHFAHSSILRKIVQGFQCKKQSGSFHIFASQPYYFFKVFSFSVQLCQLFHKKSQLRSCAQCIKNMDPGFRM